MQAARGASLSSSDPSQTPEAAASAQTAGPASRRRCLALFASVALVAYAIDLTTKVLAVEHLTGRAPVPVVGDLLSLSLIRNPGAAFSTGTSFTMALSLVAIAAALAVLWFARRLGSASWAVGLGLLLGGILGNLTDRLFRAPGFLEGHVVDFLRLPNWPIFNVADICINVAAGVVILQTIRGIALDGSRTSRPGAARTSGPDPGAGGAGAAS